MIIDSCYNRGMIELITDTENWAALGGISAQTDGTISNCFNTGILVYQPKGEGIRKGFIAGRCTKTVNNCFYKVDSENDKVTLGVGEYLKQGGVNVDAPSGDVDDISNVTDWQNKLVTGSKGNFVNNGGDYPVLYWEVE